MGCTGVKRNTREEGKHWPKTTPYGVTASHAPGPNLAGVRREERPIVIAFD
jgi:hypothetical protein